MALLLQRRDAPGPGLGDVDLLLGQQVHELRARAPILEQKSAMLAQLLPHRIHVGDVVGVLIGLQRAVPDAGLPVGPAADLALELGLEQQVGAKLAGFRPR
jgi:hypothetical protein